MRFIYDNFDVLFDTPESIESFKKLVLEMAVRGKLVPQDPNDEPAGVLLQKIKKEKEILIKEGKIRKEKPLPPIREEDVPFELPESWEWVRLGEVTQINPRNYLEDELTTSFIPMKLIDQGFISNHTYETKKWEEIKNGFTHFMEDDVVIAKITPCFENRKSAVMKNLINQYGAGTTELHVLRSYGDSIYPYYLLSIVKTTRFINDGVNTYTGTAGQQRVKKEFVSNYCIPLPPFNEQKRIVQKIDEIFNLLTPLSEAMNQRAEYNRLLNKTSIHRLNTSTNIEALTQNMHFILNNFDTLYGNIENVEELRQAILTLAVQGKLVPQDPNDEPASVLLEKIKAEKEQLIKEGKLKKEKPLPPVREEEIPFELPESWKWVRLGEIGEVQTGTTPPTSHKEYFNGDIPFIKPADITSNGINYHNETITDSGLKKGRLIKKNSVMMVCIGGSIGKSYYTTMDASCNQQINTFTGFLNIEGIFINYFVSANFFQDEVLRQATGSATPIINKGKWERILFPLPPHNEQKRIIQQIDMLMALCDDLEKKIEHCRVSGEQLLQSVLYANG